MIIAIFILATVAAIALSGFYSGSETGLYSVSRIRMRIDAENGNAKARRLLDVLQNDRSALSTLLVGTNIANYLATVFVAYILTNEIGIAGESTELYTTAIVTPVVFVFGEVVPKTLFQRHSDVLMLKGSRLLAWSKILFAIPVKALTIVSAPLLKLAGSESESAEVDHRLNVALMLQDAFATEEHSDMHGELVERVLNLTELPLHQVMVPRNRVISVELGATRQECLATIRRNAHSRLLVYNKDPRRIVGFVSTHSLLASDEWTNLEDHLEPIQTLTPQQSVATAMMTLQTEGSAIAAVVDRGNRLLGVVTFKDLLEELSGELHDW
ncbi:MAG TPA: CNNM domain-containing protein [Phycisphaerae bacterium]|nr:CNNM domain-containing protein [Phycisphaerae bacterium]